MQTSTRVADDVQKSIDAWAVEENFLAVVWMRDDAMTAAKLTPEQDDRLRENLRVVERLARRMAANMLKGIFKYGASASATDRSPEEWYEYAVDEQIDALLELGLLRESMREPQRGERDLKSYETFADEVGAAVDRLDL